VACPFGVSSGHPPACCPASQALAIPVKYTAAARFHPPRVRCLPYTSGSYEQLAEHWNGTTWTVQPTPSPHGGDLTSVSCTSAAACTAVGFYDAGTGGLAALADRWNGTSWAIQRT
jgi:hypothetical protein